MKLVKKDEYPEYHHLFKYAYKGIEEYFHEVIINKDNVYDVNENLIREYFDEYHHLIDENDMKSQYIIDLFNELPHCKQ